MNPVTMQMISADQAREMRAQAAAWRRAREARGVGRARASRFPLALVARNARFLTGQKRLHDPLAA